VLLSELKIGQKCRIDKMNNSENIKRRLNNMGLVEGITITLVRVAPLKDPVEIKLRDFYLAIRKKQTKKIEVTVLE
jgi:Fe2+ transport system protein FeoA